MDIKLIALDMDGTLLDDDHVTVPRRNVEALRSAHDRGVKIALASGRSWSLLAGAVEQLECVDYGLCANGALVLDGATGETLYSRAMPNRQALAIIGILQAHKIPFEVYCQGKNYVRLADKALVRHNNPPSYVDFFEQVTTYPADLAVALAGREVEKFNCFAVPVDKRESIEAAVRATGPVEVANAFGLNMEFALGGVTKGSGLGALCARLGLEAGQVMAFGDAGNDLEMLAFAGWSFAMANGSETAKACARYLAPANIEAGVGQMVEKYVLEP